MMLLPLPEDHGDRCVLDQCGKPGWAGFRARWLTATAAYRQFSGNPWKVSPQQFEESEQLALRGLYDTRRRSGAIARIRKGPEDGYRSCPMCGSSGGRSLDHALPRQDFPEFSIVRENLVPACTICNSNEKGTTYRGSAPPERLIHPYYDHWASKAIWIVEFGSDLDAVVPRAVPHGDLTDEQRRVVEFHLSTVLGGEWEESSRRYWATLPQQIQQRIDGSATPKKVRQDLEKRLAEKEFEQGLNGWHPALLRGVLNDDRIPDYLADRVNALPMM